MKFWFSPLLSHSPLYGVLPYGGMCGLVGLYFQYTYVHFYVCMYACV